MYIDKYQRVTQVRTQLVANNNKQKEKVSSIEKTNIQNLNCETHSVGCITKKPQTHSASNVYSSRNISVYGFSSAVFPEVLLFFFILLHLLTMNSEGLTHLTMSDS